MTPDDKPVLDEPPPILGAWPRLYALVLLYLALLIGSFYIFTVRLAP